MKGKLLEKNEGTEELHEELGVLPYLPGIGGDAPDEEGMAPGKQRENLGSPLCADPARFHSCVCQQHLSPSQLGCEVLQRLLKFGHQCGGLGPEPFAPQLPSLATGSFSPLENLRHHLQIQRNYQNSLNYGERRISST